MVLGGSRVEEELRPLVLSVEQAATMLGIGRSLAWGLVKKGDIRSLRKGRRVLIPRDEILRLIEEAY